MVEEKLIAREGLDLRQHLALERTLLAYVRTGLALVGVGFVIARSGLLLKEMGGRAPTSETGLSLWFGTALVFLGSLIGPMATVAYRRQLFRLNEAMGLKEKPATTAVAVSVVLSVVGAGMGAYLIANPQ